MKTRLAVLSSIFALFVIMPSSAEEEEGGEVVKAESLALTAKGNEPFWNLRIEGDLLVFQTPEGDQRGKIEGEMERDEESGVTRHAGVLDGGRVIVTFTPEVTMDSMSGMPHPARVLVTMPDGEELTGVGGDPLDLLVGGWRVTLLGDEPVGEKPPTIEFARDGRVFGDASCNRFTGTFTLTGEGLGFSPLATTRRLCEPEVMVYERKFLARMAEVNGFTIGEAGELVLTAAEAPAVTAVRP